MTRHSHRSFVAPVADRGGPARAPLASAGKGIGLGLALVLLLSGCAGTGPAPNGGGTGDPPAGAPTVLRLVAVRGDAPALQGHNSDTVHSELQRVASLLQASQVGLAFVRPAQVLVDPRVNVVDDAFMRSYPGQAQQLVLVMSEAIDSCGAGRGNILGCTPRPGMPVLFVKTPISFFETSASAAIIWAHEMGHTAGLGHAGPVQRLMHPAPTNQSTQIQPPENGSFAWLGQRVGDPASGPAMAAVASPQVGRLLQNVGDNLSGTLNGVLGGILGGADGSNSVAPEPFVVGPTQGQSFTDYLRQAGHHGIDSRVLQNLPDADVLRASALLDGAQPTGARINALVALAEFGGPRSQAAARDHILQARGSGSLEVRRYGLRAMGRGLLLREDPASRTFLVRGQDPNFWCAGGEQKPADCQALADASATGLRNSRLSKDPLAEPTEPTEPNQDRPNGR